MKSKKHVGRVLKRFRWLPFEETRELVEYAMLYTAQNNKRFRLALKEHSKNLGEEYDGWTITLKDGGIKIGKTFVFLFDESKPEGFRHGRR